jgi:hypothetical protein
VEDCLDEVHEQYHDAYRRNGQAEFYRRMLIVSGAGSESSPGCKRDRAELQAAA